MRGYISKIMYGPDHPEYEFTRSIAHAWFWQSESSATAALAKISHEGIVVNPPWRRCPVDVNDFRIEERPQGGFGISCALPQLNKNSFVLSSFTVSRSFAAFSNSNFFAASRISVSSFAM